MEFRRNRPLFILLTLLVSTSLTFTTAHDDSHGTDLLRNQTNVEGSVQHKRMGGDIKKKKKSTVLNSSTPVNAKGAKKKERWDIPSREESTKRKRERSRRMKERRERAQAKIRGMKPHSKVEKMTSDDMGRVRDRALKDDPELKQPQNQWLRRVSSSNDPYTIPYLANPGEEYDWWAQAYRMLGGFIDCDHNQDGDSHSNSGDGGDGDGCSRWMMWASYVNPNYQGGGRSEYFGNYGANNNFYQFDDDEVESEIEKLSPLDCHSPETEWQLLGVYRQEFYQFLEQISKHVWAIDEYEYIVALAGLAYMTDADCWNVGYDEKGNSLYAGVLPMSKGEFQMALFTDSSCLYVNEDTAYTYDDFAEISDMDLGSQDGNFWGDDYDNEDYQQAYSNWAAAQTYTLDLINEVYTEYKYCTLCLDYPTYQDGYFIGDYGTDEDDLINQCWKFHSHDSYPCESDCVSLGAAQGSIVQFKFGGKYYGDSWDGSSGLGSSTNYDRVGRSYVSQGHETKLDKLKANLFVTTSGILFVATFLAFAVSKGSRSSGGSKSRALLSDDDRRSRDERRSKSKEKSKSKSRRTKSREKKEGRRSRSKSASGKSRRRSRSTKRSNPIVDDF